MGSSNRNSLSIIGIKNANVLPLPVTACISLILVYDMPQNNWSYLNYYILVRHEQWYSGGLHGRHAIEALGGDGI